MNATAFFVVSMAAAAALVFGSSAPATAAQPTANDAGFALASLPACVGVFTEARYVPYGYNHIVTVKNGCSKSATCSVATDVNPQARAIEVASAATVDVLTFSASPAQTFLARVSCTLHD